MEQENNQNNTQQPNTQPAENGDQGGGKLFTQEEVNTIVRDRLARERAKNTPPEPTEEEKRLKDLTDRENRISCREYVLEHGIPAQLLEVLDTSNHEEFKKKADIVSGLLKAKPISKVDSIAIVEMKRRIAKENGIPDELAPRLMGDTEADIYKDVAVVQRIVRAIKGPPPLYDPESCRVDAFGAGFQKTKHTPKQYPPFDTNERI